MAYPILSVTIIITIVTLSFAWYRLRILSSQILRNEEAEKPVHLNIDQSLPERTRQFRINLIGALPECVISPENETDFKDSMKKYWDQKACEVPPACTVRPRNVEELAQVVGMLVQEFHWRHHKIMSLDDAPEVMFAVRSGGHCPVDGASSIRGGVLIDMKHFNQITLSPDEKSVVLGAGCRWMNVSDKLAEKGLAVLGGRNSAVGVGGLIIGGGLSFFSPRYGFVCSSVIECEIVLADGSITKASAIEKPDLWRALKGGGNNFGIITSYKVRTFASSSIWSGFLYIPPFEAPRVLSTFHESIDSVVAKDEYAAGPLACFTYLQQLGIQAIAVNLVHTNPPKNEKKWPVCWQNSGFTKLWRFWSSCQVRTLTSATDEMSVLNPPGRRQEFATTTIQNDRATIEAAHKAYRDAIATVRQHNIKKMSWTLVLQPLLPIWARKGDPNPLGLDSGSDNPLVIVSFTVNWVLAKDDATVQKITREAIEQIDAFAEKHGTDHRFRYMNYCGGWQSPFRGYGEENEQFLREISRKYDPEGIFQKACVGGFKLNM